MIDCLREIVGGKNVFPDEPMREHTTFRVGGNARALVEPESASQLQAVLSFCRDRQIPHYIVGNGSNLLVSDEGYHGVIIHIFKNMEYASVHGNRMELEAGVLLMKAAKLAKEHALTGLEFASGIPGTVGGGVMMNAGAYGGEMKDVVERVTVLEKDGVIRSYTGGEMRFGYRRSRVNDGGGIILSAGLCLTPGEPERIQARMEELRERRRTKQPLEYASAGSTFKRPEGYFAGKLIEDAGLRGFRMGDAQVSEKHCGFLINRGNATAGEIAALIREVQKRVYENSGVRLEPEIRFLGSFE